MEIKARTKNSILILDLSGRIDVDSANLVEAVGQCLRDGYKDIVCNFEEVDFVDYLGISAIAIAYREVVNSSGRMKFCSIPAQLKNIFSVTGLDRVIDMYGSEDLAVDALQEDTAIENIKKLQLRRRFKRLPIGIKAELRDKFAKNPDCLHVDILNLSAIGAFVYGCGKFKLGDMVVMKFKLAPRQEEIEIEGKIVWLPDKQIQLPLSPGMGVEFINISSGIQEKLIEFIERNVSRMSSED